MGGNTTVDLYHDVEVLELEDDGGPQTPCFKPSGFDLSDSFEAFGEFIGGVPIVCGGSLPQNDNRFDRLTGFIFDTHIFMYTYVPGGWRII